MEVKQYDYHVIVLEGCPFIAIHEVVDQLTNHQENVDNFIGALVSLLEKLRAEREAQNN